MFHHSASRRGGRTGYRSTTHSPSQPSSAAAKAAAAAKALHRRAQEKQKQVRQSQSDDAQGCGNQSPNLNPRNDVFRKSSLVRDGCHVSHGEGGSVLKRLTAGNDQCLQIGPSGGDNLKKKSVQHASLVQSESEKDSTLHAATSKYLCHTSPGHAVYPYPPSGVSGAYPPGPYGHPQPHLFMHHHGLSFPDDGKGQTDRYNHHNVGKELVDHPDDDEKSRPHYPTTTFKAHHCSAPYFDGRFLEPSLAHHAYPYGAHPSHYPGYYPPVEARNVLPSDYSENIRKKQHGAKVATPVRAAPKSPISIPSNMSTKKSENKTAIQKEDIFSLQPPLSSRSTQRIIGSHTPIHVPRADIHETEEEPLPYRQLMENKVGSDPGSVFRSSDQGTSIRGMKNPHSAEDEDDFFCESSAHKILLSLSKSFDRVEEVKHLTRGVSQASRKVKEEPPKSPDEPPRIQHWHKQSSDTFEPQPSPLKLSHLKDADGRNIDLASSFTLFNESFDMNIEGLLGPNASFGLGPMRSLSFGFGVGASADNGDNTRSIPTQRHNSMLSQNGSDAKEGEHAPRLGKLSSPENLQVLQTSPSSSFGNVFRSSIHGVDNSTEGKNPIMVLVDARRVGSPLLEDHGYATDAREGTNYVVIDGSTKQVSISSRINEGSFRPNESTPQESLIDVDVTGYDTNAKKHSPPKIERSLFGAMERHSAMFNTFSFLLPGAKTIFMEDGSQENRRNTSWRSHAQLTERDKEVARRRVNSALCAFGGIVVPPTDSELLPMSEKRRKQRYKELISERYYEDENRLSWEIEEDPPIEVSDSEEYHSNFEISSKMKASGEEVKKRNHGCPLNASLQRNIGVMVYPAVNAFTATEPGIITPALSEMNNFLDKSESPPESTPAKILNESSIGTNSFLPLVSPDSIRPGTQNAESSSFSSNRKTPMRSVNYAGGAWISNHQSPRKVSPGKNSESPSPDLLFVDVQDLRPEQYRIVAQKKRKASSSCYLYPALPLPYGQRKRISNAMFAMSKSIPGLTDECASVLGEARRKDAWDFAVAQLMTQVIVVTHCSVQDSRLDGLSKYLLTLGIAC